jgi:hypothetical protein
MSARAKAVIAVLGVVVVGLAGMLIWSTADGGTAKLARSTIRSREVAKQAERFKRHRLEARIRAVRKAATKRNRAEQRKEVEATAIDGSPSSPVEAVPPGAPPKHLSQSSAKSSAASSSSFAALESEISGEIGVAYAPIGPSQPRTLGPLQVGHAWSSFKVPIVTTVMLKQNGHLSSGQESLAASAIEASDNEAAAALFSELESITGGGASRAVEETLEAAGAPTEVATAPPPPGAVSSWGQTEWPLSASTTFYGALTCGAFGGATETILGDMENVIPEQQWGLGQASFPSGTSVAIKAGWGPDGSESGPYLVRQAGIIRSAQGGAVITIAAQDASGSFEAGVADLDQVADWVAQNVPLDGSC